MLKTAPVAQLADAIKAAADGSLTFQVSAARSAAGRVTGRELDVVRLLIDGRSNGEIGVALGIGMKTVESHLRRLFERFGLVSRTELAARALREGWLDIPPA